MQAVFEFLMKLYSDSHLLFVFVIVHKELWSLLSALLTVPERYLSFEQ